MTQTLKVQTRGGTVTFCNDDGGAAAEAFARKHGGKILANEDPGKGVASFPGVQPSTSVPVFSAGGASLLGLEPGAASREPGEYRAAYLANSRKHSPRITEKIVQALISYWRTKRGGDVDSTVAFLKDRHPALFPDVLRETAGTAAGANERLACNEVEMLAIGPTVQFA